MKNNNTTIVRNITKRVLSSDKKRNFFVIAAIVLTTFMITSVFSIGLSEYESVNMQNKRMQGSLSSMGFNRPTDEQLSKIQSLDYVKTVGIGAHIGQISDYSSIRNMNELEIVYVDRTQWQKMFSPTFTNIIGRYAEKDDEIMLSRYILDAMGIKNPKIGMEIPMSFKIDGNDEIITKTFILSCIYTEYTHLKRDGYGSIYTSAAFAENYNKLTADNIIVNVIFKDEENISENIEKLKEDLNFTPHQSYIQNPAISDKKGWSSDYTALLVISLFLMFTGYLLIYNVMYISVSRDVQFYGMLKTLGTTSKQIRHIVIGQVLRLCLIGIPVGCVAAAVISLLVVPAIIINSGIKTGAIVSFSPLIYMGAIIFATLTALLAAITPAKKAANIAPIDALKYTGEKIYKKEVRHSKKLKPYKMALRNIFRDRRRALIVILSLFLSMVSFTSIVSIVNGIDIDNYVNAQYDYDFFLSSNQTDKPFLDEKLVNEARELSGFKETGITTLGTIELQYSKELEKYADWLSQKYSFPKENMIENGFFRLGHGIRGIDPIELKLLNKTLAKPIDEEAFERGEIALINILDDSIYEYLSDIVSLGIKFEGEEVIRILINELVSLSAIRSGTYESTTMQYSQMEILVSNNFIREHSSPQILYMNANVNKGLDEKIYKSLIDFLKDSNIKITSRYDGRKIMGETKTIMIVLGGGLSMILGFIGIFNFINVMSVSVVSRKLEFATLESIGMSKKQMKSMLKNEGLGYAIITILIASSIGSVISYEIFRLFQKTFEYASFNYPFIPSLIMYIFVISVCIITPNIAYKGINKMTITERLRDV